MSYLIAALLVTAVAVWMASGLLVDREEPSQRPQSEAEPAPVLVETTRSRAAPVERFIVAHGDVLAFRRAVVRAETAGRVAEIAVREGGRVSPGQLLVHLSLEARGSELAEAKAELARLERDLASARQLARSGAETRQRVRALEAQVAAARASVARVTEEIEDTSVGAPFAGVVNDIAVDPGEFVSIGAELATLIDNDPLRVEAQIAQQSIAMVERGAVATVSFATGRTARGRVCFISAAANPETRTFAVEIQVANPGHETPSRISAEVRLPTGEVDAHKISPAILSLGTRGQLGVKTVVEGRVEFHPIEIVRAEADGVWVTGLPDEAQIITLGQGFVRNGETVRVAPDGALPERTGSTSATSLPTATTRQALSGDSPNAPPADEALADCAETAGASADVSSRGGEDPR